MVKAHWLKKYLKVLPVFVIAAVILWHYTVLLTRDPYTRIYQTRFKEVEGLKRADKVQCLGVDVGKVQDLLLDPDGNFVTVVYRVLPQLEIARGSEVEIVSANAFGTMRLEIRPELPEKASDIYKSTEVIEGINPEASALVESLKRRDKDIDRAISEIEDATADLNTDSKGGLGALLNDRAIALDFERSLLDLEQTAGSASFELHDIEAGAGTLGAAVSPRPQLRERISAQLQAAEEGLAETTVDLHPIHRDQDGAGRMLVDPDRAAGLRSGVKTLRRSTGSMARGEGGLAKFLLEPEGVQGIEDTTGELARSLREARRPESTLGGLIDKPAAARSARETLESLDSALRRARRGEGTLGTFLADPDTLDRARELLGDVKRLLDEADDGIRAAVAGQPINTIHGAVFSVF